MARIKYASRGISEKLDSLALLINEPAVEAGVLPSVYASIKGLHLVRPNFPIVLLPLDLYDPPTSLLGCLNIRNPILGCAFDLSRTVVTAQVIGIYVPPALFEVLDFFPECLVVCGTGG
jgi:hypothetical protein